MNRIITACDAFDLHFLEIRYNDAEDSCAPAQIQGLTESETCRISIDGMTCGACSAAITKELESVNGVFRASVSLALGRATISYDTRLTTTNHLLQAIQDAGYDGTVGERSSHETIERLRQSDQLRSLRGTISSASLCAMVILALEYMPLFSPKGTLLATQYNIVSWIILLLATRVQLWDAWSIHARAWSGQSRVAATMDTLLSLSLILGLGLAILQTSFGSFGASAQSYASSGSFLTVVILGGKYLEAVLQRESNMHLIALYEIQTEKEKYQLLESTIAVPASLLKKGDAVLIQPQHTIPCDCYIIDGSSAINEASITGEALPLTRGIGDFLLAGTRNISHPLKVIICQDQSASSLAKVIEGVSAASEQRLEGTESLDMVMRAFVSGVILLATAAFVVTLCRHHKSPVLVAFMAACERTMPILAAACPCSIGLATPSAAMAGVDAAYSKGVLISGGIKTMEAMEKATHIVMDKTGTLTEGSLNVMGCHFDDGVNMNKTLCYRLLAAAEAGEARVHPVAKAIFKWSLVNCHQVESLHTRGVILETRNVIRVLGQGTSCKVCAYSNTWIQVHIGTRRYLEQCEVTVPQSAPIETSGSVVHFAFDHRYGGRLLVQDTIRPEAASVIKGMLNDGLQITMLTGDAAPEASRISSLLNIPVLASRASPSDKMCYVQALREQGHRVVMVGDGINDSLAQAAADVGVSISLTQGCLAGAGSVVILSGDLRGLAASFSMSRRVMAQAKMNIRWALIYNVIALSSVLGLFERWGVVITA